MTTWKRWPWYYRVGALFALALLLQGASCPYVVNFLPRYQVPGVSGNVIPEKYVDGYGRRYYVVEHVQTRDGRDYPYMSYHYYDSAEYQRIDAYFRVHTELQVIGYDRSAIPGGTGALPSLAAQ